MLNFEVYKIQDRQKAFDDFCLSFGSACEGCPLRDEDENCFEHWLYIEFGEEL